MNRGKCDVPICVALPVEGSRWCAVHTAMDEQERIDAALRTVGLVGPMRPITDRIERDAEGQPVRFYPETRR